MGNVRRHRHGRLDNVFGNVDGEHKPKPFG